MDRCAVMAALLVALTMTGCSDSKKNIEPEPNVFPAGYKQDIIDTLSRTLDDPTNVRAAFISDPVIRTAEKDQRYSACVRYNARDLNRQYVGSKDQIAYFFAGRLNQLIDATLAQCGNAVYKPFPELERLCFAKKCD